ncbi:MAG: cyanophycin synthetase, partial [Rhodothermales bacterium]|nr:cyanophycin synthetase [Rhodothermales bacterium]
VATELGVSAEHIQKALSHFEGIGRRMHMYGDIKTECGVVTLIDDYAHHPVEVAATIKTATEVWPERRIVAVFQPHLYSRTRDLLDEFAGAFGDADLAVVTDVYPARERPVDGVSGRLVVDRARALALCDVSYVEDVSGLPEYLLTLVRPGDAVVFMGAGDIWRYSRVFAGAVSPHEVKTTPRI